ncbi:glycoside hydrolase family 28 [Ginsengibacter hankyongi]|uniref:Glycoside hydrolase family 28 n=2 Tax=Ginsengibacter hankyongi TaxID=2607284 RepID=A0A5J5IPP8_9BACT|nr:glycoside hydrolase family 28 [Ginsengibacter hankyongi]
MVACFGQKRDFVITDYGAIPDGVTNNVIALQHAIDDANKNGGGRVVVPRGRFLSGVIHLKSNVELFVHEEAVLLASTDRADYGPSQSASAWIVADHANNISITGNGTIDGQCDLLIQDIYKKLKAGELYDIEWKQYNDWHQRRPSESNRPRMIEFRNCDSVTIKNIHLQNGTSWIQDYKNCSNLKIDSVHVFSNTFLNNDGIDVVDCKNARITNCIINAADDGICLKSEDSNRRCENIYVANCKVRSSASAVKLGTASRGGFKNIVIKNIEVYNTFRSAIAIESVDGGRLEDVDVQHIHAVNTGNAIFIRLGHRNKDSVISQLRNVFISDVTVEVPKGKPDKDYPMEGPELRAPSKNEDTTVQYPNDAAPWDHFSIDTSSALIPHNVFPSSVTGFPGHPVENVVLQNITIIYDGGGDKSLAHFPLDSFNKIPEAITNYPEFSMFGELPAWGLYVRHVKGITLKNIKLVNKTKDYRVSLLMDDAQKVTVQNFSVEGATSLPTLFFNDVKPLVLNNIKAPGKRNQTIKIKTTRSEK